MPFPIKPNFFLFFVLISHSLGNPQTQEDEISALSSSFPLSHTPVAPLDSHLTSSGQTIDGNWDNKNEASLQTSPDPPTDNTDTPLIADESVGCAKPAQKSSKLRRSRLDKRQKSFCPWQEFRDPPSPKPPEEGKQGALSPTDGDQFWSKLNKESSLYNLLILLERAPGTNGETNLNVCEGTVGRTIPVCFPFVFIYPLELGSPAPLLEPCRFWSLNDVCIETYEELWCCVAAKKRSTEHLNISPSDFELGLRYSAAGVDCERVVDPTRNLQVLFL